MKPYLEKARKAAARPGQCFRSLIKPPMGQKSLLKSEVVGMLGDKHVNVYVETSGNQHVRILITQGDEMIQTARIETYGQSRREWYGYEAGMQWLRDLKSFKEIRLVRETAYV